jgi:molybdopterin-containing oxidoreductase family iron-sulfur binding subunit
MVACAAENNVPSLPDATPRTGLTPLLVYRASNGKPGPERREVFLPVMCMQCEHETPCVSVCPQQAVEVDKTTGIVTQMPQRCLGCRYCMAACPYHARYFNWWDPQWPAGMEKTLNPGVAVRMRGVVEKCNLCHARLHAAEDKAAAAGQHDIAPATMCLPVPSVSDISNLFRDLSDRTAPCTRLHGNRTHSGWRQARNRAEVCCGKSRNG